MFSPASSLPKSIYAANNLDTCTVYLPSGNAVARRHGCPTSACLFHLLQKSILSIHVVFISSLESVYCPSEHA